MLTEPLPFVPHPLVRGGHLQTIVGYYLPARKSRGGGRKHRVEVSDGDHIVLCENRVSRKSIYPAVVVLMHGLGGDASSPYMLRIARTFIDRGWTTFRMNHRGSGEGAGLARNLYHSGRSDDISAALQQIARQYPDSPIVAVGFSLSGNALLKLLGEGRHPYPDNLEGAISVTPPIELSRCSDAISQTSNRLYDLRFIRMLRQAIEMRRKSYSDFPNFSVSWRATLREFDEVVTAPMNGFKSAEEYYEKCSAKQFLGNITLPAVLLASADDPFIPVQTYDNLPKNERLTVNITHSGGHMGYVASDKTPIGNHLWLDYAVLTYAESLLTTANRISADPKQA